MKKIKIQIVVDSGKNPSDATDSFDSAADGEQALLDAYSALEGTVLAPSVASFEHDAWRATVVLPVDASWQLLPVVAQPKLVVVAVVAVAE